MCPKLCIDCEQSPFSLHWLCSECGSIGHTVNGAKEETRERKRKLLSCFFSCPILRVPYTSVLATWSMEGKGGTACSLPSVVHQWWSGHVDNPLSNFSFIFLYTCCKICFSRIICQAFCKHQLLYMYIHTHYCSPAVMHHLQEQIKCMLFTLWSGQEHWESLYSIPFPFLSFYLSCPPFPFPPFPPGARGPLSGEGVVCVFGGWGAASKRWEKLLLSSLG